MAERARNGGRSVFPRARTFGTTAVTAGQQFSWIWSRESLLRLVLSLVLSLALWLYVSNRENPRIVQDYSQPLPIQLSALPSGTTVDNADLGDVYLRIRRTDPNVPVTPASFRVFVDLTGLKPGLHHVPVQVVSDPGIDVVEQRPTSVLVQLDRLQYRRVPVKMHVLSKPPAGYGYSISYKPGSAQVSGPPDQISQVQQATAYLELRNLTSTLPGDYKLNPETDSGSGVTGHITLRPPTVHVKVTVHPFSSFKTLPVLVQFSGLPKQGYGVAGVTVSPAQVSASGSPSTLSHISTVNTTSISVNHRGGGSFKKTLRVLLPKGVHSHTHVVKVQVKIAPIQSSTSVEIGIQPQGVAPGLITHILPGRVLVTATGPANALHAIAGSTHATVNLTGFGPGVYRLRPVVKSSQKKLKLEAIYPRIVTVQLRSSS
jgi:YbbR domain-containing protein